MLINYSISCWIHIQVTTNHPLNCSDACAVRALCALRPGRIEAKTNKTYLSSLKWLPFSKHWSDKIGANPTRNLFSPLFHCRTDDSKDMWRREPLWPCLQTQQEKQVNSTREEKSRASYCFGPSQTDPDRPGICFSHLMGRQQYVLGSYHQL